MSNRQQLSKPNADITNYEWEVTPPSVKIFIDRLEKLVQHKQKILDSTQVENSWLREQLDLQLNKQAKVKTPSMPEVFLWATIGLILTIGGTFIPAYAIAFPWHWGEQGLQLQTLQVSYQVGAVLLTGCLGGGVAALLSQLTYVILGLTWLPIFDRGGGWEYIQEPSFGYLLGFILGAWVCGLIAYKAKASLNLLAGSCLAGLLTIHIIGIIYFTVLSNLPGLENEVDSIWQNIITYSVNPLSGQLAVVCAISLIAYLLRKLMFS